MNKNNVNRYTTSEPGAAQLAGLVRKNNVNRYTTSELGAGSARPA